MPTSWARSDGVFFSEAAAGAPLASTRNNASPALLPAAMLRVPRLALQAALGAVALLAIVLIAAIVLLDPAKHKPRIEAAASRVLGMEVNVNGPLSLRWRPHPHLLLHDVHAHKRGAEIARVREVAIDVEWRTLLSRDVRVRSIALHDGVLAIVRERDGRFNFQRDAPGPSRPPHDGPDVSFTRATIRYADARSPRRIEGRQCRGELQRIHMAGGERRFLAGLSLQGEAACAEVRAGKLVLADASTTAVAKDGVFEFQPLKARLFDTPASARLRADFSAAAPAYEVEHTLRQVPTQPLLQALSLREVASGRVDVSARLAMRGRTADELQRSMQGTVSLRGRGLTYHGADLDAQFKRFDSSRNFNLLDVGALFLAGPAGLIVTKGVDMAATAQGEKGHSEIRTLVSDWSVERGVARTHDVAMATATHRVALKGEIDLVNERFDAMVIALVDPKGCVKAQQQVRGPLRKPVVERRNPIEAIAAPAARLIKKGAELVGADSCDVFYAGAVPAPTPKQ
jgi:hypothetical protein